jgi:L-aminopeptidase/D-esterase-like protein
MLPNDMIEQIFESTVFATEEAIVNAMVAADTMVGADDHKIIRLPHDQLQAVLKKYNRLQ